ncbi:MAG: acetylornithine/succinyldiaminopimelate transaminase [Snodgrassella sp.]|uniref:acetylornithine/succinyldiaminopimelate transaminase n=1 Tax=Snodgrassella TaxID=1193515 RepID=UPI00081552F9|nr:MULTISPECIES: acetylornithine/succinyldiaminopimelate transaminase [Snodgrassella]MCO6506925.1 acetylornithine/succinyldiaminopimelate transaminase [Snodgrassella sp.]MCO6522030.1 acetylornithine/succinyldiaminopimelate transaminase [Snodgrassella sp.]WMY92644.1 acetylornithine/succinyldiaminopimelate transaminase [Snodgrassella communis]SCB88573.1 acetylornithine/N-succinyldiaminopimelate aminotransferase [Snodgrassella sp. R-53583]
MHNYLTPNFNFAPMFPEHGQGSRVWDKNGQEYIDLAGGIAVNALGHCHPILIEALTAQAHKLWHISNIYTTQPAQELAQRLVKDTFAEQVFFCNSGAEANEAAFKLARKYARDHFAGTDKHEIIACVNGFHGRTLFTVSVGGQSKYSDDFAPLPGGIRHIPFNDVAALDAAVNDKTCAVVIEPIQGESGVLPANAEFLLAARKACDRHRALLIFDEVQTGMGRTGKLFAHQYYDVQPDIVSSAKALGCGIPIGAMLTTAKVGSSFTPGSHGSTFGGNPLACAVGCAAFDIINTPETMQNVLLQGEKLQAGLQELGTAMGVFSQVRGQGLLLGCVMSDEYKGRAAQLMQLALQHGVLVLVAGQNVLRLAPSLLLTDADLQAGLQRLKAAITAFVHN